ncbi:MAG: Gfo/Idh/MocA family oxidoreductase [Spirochaetaceae bacterium]|nr:Gfo/Idh/MocA family oxidoreductase [Spirochaetaceae bacterium]
MARELRIGIIGLDSSHTIEFTRRFQAPDCPPEQRVSGATVTRCMRFETPFQDRAGLDGRQKQLEGWGVEVTEDFDTAVAGADAVLIEINDPGLHLEYVRRCAGLGVPLFLDKPLAEDLAAGLEIARIAAEHDLRLCSTSSLRFAAGVRDACAALPEPRHVTTFGPINRAAAGSSIVWYGVHAVEMLVRAIGRGARTASTHRWGEDAIVVVDYADGRTGVVELFAGGGYGGVLRSGAEVVPYTVDHAGIDPALLNELVPFLAGGASPVPLEDAVEVIAILDAAERSSQAGGAAAMPVGPVPEGPAAQGAPPA